MLRLHSLPKVFAKGVRCYSAVTPSATQPLKLLFCGSDDFSISSLRALYNLHKTTNDPARFASIDVVCRPGKRVGRGLKKIREVPIKNVAEQLQLPVHEIDTFTGWTPPTEFNLIVAVSFGLFVPPRILRSAKYGGINVHPSLLPDFRGPAPLHHVLLAGEKYTGITIQTLSETGFDQGRILAQTPPPGLAIPNPDSCTPAELLEFVTPLAGEMLSTYVYDTYLKSPDRDEKEAIPRVESDRPFDRSLIRHAPKITPADREIDWETWNAEELLRRDRVLGRLWTRIRVRNQKTNQIHEKRIVLQDYELLPENFRETAGLPLDVNMDGKSIILVTKPDNRLLRINSITIDGKNKQAAAELCSLGKCSLEKRIIDIQ